MTDSRRKIRKGREGEEKTHEDKVVIKTGDEVVESQKSEVSVEVEKKEVEKRVEIAFPRSTVLFEKLVNKVINDVNTVVRSDEWEKYVKEGIVKVVNFCKVLEDGKTISEISFGAWISSTRRPMYGLVVTIRRDDGSTRLITIPFFREEDLEKFVKSMKAFTDETFSKYISIIRKYLISGRRRRKIEEVGSEGEESGEEQE